MKAPLPEWMSLLSASQFWLDYGRPLSPNVPHAEAAKIALKVSKYCIHQGEDGTPFQSQC